VRDALMPLHAQAGHLAGQLGLLPRHRHVGDRRQVVHLGGLDPLHGRDQAALIQQVTADQPDLAEQLADPPDPGIGLAPDQAPYLISLREQVFSQVGAVLAGDPGDQCAFGHGLPADGHGVSSAALHSGYDCVSCQC
jgi:hypothetical protein